MIGGMLGTLLTYAVCTLQRPRFLKSAMSTFAGVASQFGGVPLAFAFVASIGSAGLVTSLLNKIGLDLYGSGFSLLSFSGLVIVYLYFQIPLMLIIMTPAVEGLRQSWREAVRFGVAAGAAAVMTPGTELCRREDAERLYKQLMHR